MDTQAIRLQLETLSDEALKSLVKEILDELDATRKDAGASEQYKVMYEEMQRTVRAVHAEADVARLNVDELTKALSELTERYWLVMALQDGAEAVKERVVKHLLPRWPFRK